MIARDILQIAQRSLVPICPPARAWLSTFDDYTPARDVFAALPSRYSTWIGTFFRRMQLDRAFMDVFDELWKQYIDCLASCDNDDAYDAWREECFTALKRDLMAWMWFEVLLEIRVSESAVA